MQASNTQLFSLEESSVDFSRLLQEIENSKDVPTPGAAEAAEASKEALFLLDTQNFGKALARLRFAFQATKPIRAFSAALVLWKAIVAIQPKQRQYSVDIGTEEVDLYLKLFTHKKPKLLAETWDLLINPLLAQGNDSSWLQCLIGLLIFETSRKDSAKAVEHFENAASAGNTAASFYLAICWQLGRGLPKDEQQAFKIFSYISPDCPSAMYNAGLCYLNGIGTKKDTEKANQLLKIAADAGSASAMCSFAYYSRQQDLNGSGRQSQIDMFHKAAMWGSAAALYHIGWFYRYGEVPVTRNMPQCLSLYETASAKGNTEAMVELAMLYENGRCVDVNVPRALELYERASTLEHCRATFYLAEMHENGVHGRKKSLALALDMYRLAAYLADSVYDVEECKSKVVLLSRLVSRQSALVSFLLALHPRCGANSLLVKYEIPYLVTVEVAKWCWSLKYSQS